MRARLNPAPWAALLIGLGLGSPAAAVEPAGAHAFVTWIFSHYPLRTLDNFDPLGRSSASVFDAPMIALFEENARLTPKGDEGALDGDPICDCQDDSGLNVRDMSVAAAGAGAAASVTFVLAGGDRRSERLDLTLVHGQWRIHDIHTRDTPSLRDYLIDANRALTHPR